MANWNGSTLPLERLLKREWLSTNHLGSFAASTVAGLNTRKYHGLLVAAMAPPVRQMVLLSRVEETIYHDAKADALANSQYPGTISPQGYRYLRAFSADPFPRWAYQSDGWTIEKEVELLADENTLVLSYALLAGARPVELELRPLFALRPIHELMYQWNGRLLVETTGQTHHRIPASSRTPEVFFAHDGHFVSSPCWYFNTIYSREEERGYAGLEDLWNPGSIRWMLEPGQTVHLVCSTDPIDIERVKSLVSRQEQHAAPTMASVAPSAPAAPVAPAAAGRKSLDDALDALVRAADQFVVGDNAKISCVIAGYPWSAPSGRDAMICLPGLLLITGKLEQAKAMLQFFAAGLERGLIASEIPTDGTPARYESADASLWLVQAVCQYLRYGGDEAFALRVFWPAVDEILRHYRSGASLGIGVDSAGLLLSGQAGQGGQATTWMDGRIGDWVITPRQGRTVEINALWYNALCIGAELARLAGAVARADELAALAASVKTAFNRLFWNEFTHCCYDVIDADGPDVSVRPNQLLAMSLAYPVLNFDRHAAVLKVMRDLLLTPVGLRTLSRDHPHYTPHYGGNVVSRDKALHQGCAFPWLLGPYVTALVRAFGRSPAVRQEAGKILDGCLSYLKGDDPRQLCEGQVCELFDGDEPHAPGGLPASARSVAEILRCHVEDVLDLTPANSPFVRGSGPPAQTYPVRMVYPT